jgi:hypothetical protein
MVSPNVLGENCDSSWAVFIKGELDIVVLYLHLCHAGHRLKSASLYEKQGKNLKITSTNSSKYPIFKPSYFPFVLPGLSFLTFPEFSLRGKDTLP